jgi:hypothetical protein
MRRPAARVLVAQVAWYLLPLTCVRGTARHSAVELLLNVMVPPPAGATVAVKVTFWPEVLGFRDEVTVVTGAGRAALITDTVSLP